jgi:hypothetical protein
MEQRPGEKWQFQTFTLKHSSDPLPDQLERLVRCFRRLRQRKLWKAHVLTGYAVIEIDFHPAGTYSPNGRLRTEDEWHPHLHVVARTDWIPWSPLRKAWLQVTGDSDNIDCEPCESATHAATYVAKYIGKAPDLALTDSPDRAAEYYHALKSRRLLIAFGPATEQEKRDESPKTPSVRIIRFADLLKAVALGDKPARQMLAKVIINSVPSSILDLTSTRWRQRLLFDKEPPCP